MMVAVIALMIGFVIGVLWMDSDNDDDSDDEDDDSSGGIPQVAGV